ncbi:TonB-dependent receptor [Janthinobacterium agaricidamnosum]|uniref:TonB-dependent Receptor Plug domain protein n=1 Tax=Janthinobacterium agaricidamnosum NBRC 102515 = DSM 9628 TaxID=1349767 RepID=W0VC54_9BURK|nr:TonB-dependent receptor [Janthinobacterium agaricidamnosum]CDG84928.1 tonB-dependent Receptor Plug domain protein [Janthinobacterium agaricidamnosum NBRC 102515 = DSM 9628]
MITETVLSRSLRLMFSGIALGLLAQPAMAQEAPASGSTVQRVEITGSNIRRAQAEGVSPVQTLSRADIEKSGKSTVAELLQTLAVDNQGSVPTSFGNGFAAGASGISLRGLGTASTLVLLNGRRIAPYGLADDGQKVFSDLNIIPADAVERVEILKDGASAIYGSDAIAGVVNIILRKDFQGTTIKASFGESGYRDGQDARLAITHGFGDIAVDKYNIITSFEYGKKNEVWNRDRSDRGYIGAVDLRNYGFSAQEALGGTGAITGPNAAVSAINGNVRNPLTNNYYNRGNLGAGTGFTRQFPGAACSNFTNHPQGDPGGGCLIDGPQQYGQMQPSQETGNIFFRGTFQLNSDLQAYTEANVFTSQSVSSTTPSGVNANVGYPGGPVSNAAVALGANHPDNPYFGTAARLRYLAGDVGPRVSSIDSTFLRFVAGLKGSYAGWDFDTALLYSQNKVSNERNGYLQRDVAFALLNPGDAVNVASAMKHPAYAALPPGTFWRIGENAGLNSKALYAALSPTISNDATTKMAQVDFKASREFGQLPGGALGIAVGAEFRHESTELEPTSGTDTGNIIGLGYSAYAGQRNVSAIYSELVAPVWKGVELSGALRADHFSDVGNSYTPKVGLKWNPVKEFALRGSFAKGFRAPSAAENGKGGLAAFSSASDPLRCALGVATACAASQIAIITSPNPDLSPEKSKSANIGFVWDPLPKTNLTIDFWQIKRTNEINQEDTTAAIAAGHVARDPSTSTKAGDPGAITAVLAKYVNSAETKVRGVDVDFRQGLDLGAGYGKLTFDAKWTHLFTFTRTEKDGSSRDFAGTHGNCDVSNCMGTPDNRVNLALTWELNKLRLTTSANYRGTLKNTLFKNDPDGCAFHFANGDDAPTGCKLASFTSIDLTGRWKLTDKAELFGTIQNLFDKRAPLDPLTYGAQSYNPLDYAGAVGRYFTGGLKYAF